MLSLSGPKGGRVEAIGISVPGISFINKGTVWAPNIEGWENYPLLEEVKNVAGDIPVFIDSDRACYILGEVWQGNAKGCKDAIFLAVGTGIGAGILINGNILRGSNDIAGCVGWMALNRPFIDFYKNCGCFEYHASGEGIGKAARKYLTENLENDGELAGTIIEEITSYDVFNAYKNGHPIAKKILGDCVEYWGMAVANLVSLFNPEKIILGGGVFGPALSLIPEILTEAEKWAQPVGIKQVKLEPSGLGGDAGVFGAGYLALKNIINLDNTTKRHV
jgi:glucokinase